MNLKELVAPSLESLISHYQSNKLLLLHPSSRYRSLLIAALLEDPPCPLFYYGLGIEDMSLSQFLTSLSHELAEQHPPFGRYLNQVRHDNSNDLEQFANALARELNDLHDSHFILILDEYDRSQDVPEIQTFIDHLLAKLPDHCHLLLNSRSLPKLPWIALVARHEAVVLKDKDSMSSSFYEESNLQHPLVEVFALGPGYVMIDGQKIKNWEGHLPRLLFFFALDKPMVTRDDICAAFWPELDSDQAVNVFHVTKRRLHKAIGFDALIHESGHYRINPDLHLQYDVVEFVNSLVEARDAEGEKAARYWQQAIDIYRGDYLQGHAAAWLEERRSDFHEGYLEALTELGAIREQNGQHEKALGLYLRAVSEAGNREDLHRAVIQLYGKLGRRSEAAAHYQKLEQNLKDEFGIEPSPETQKVYQQIIK